MSLGPRLNEFFDFNPNGFKIESQFRQHLLDLGFPRMDAHIAAENLRCFAFEELELIWDNLTWAKGCRRPGWSIYSQPEQLSKL